MDYFGKQWPEAKLLISFGQSPMLLIEKGDRNRTVCISNSICRYLAGIEGTLPDDPVDAAVMDSIGEQLHELITPLNSLRCSQRQATG